MSQQVKKAPIDEIKKIFSDLLPTVMCLKETHLTRDIDDNDKIHAYVNRNIHRRKFKYIANN